MHMLKYYYYIFNFFIHSIYIQNLFRWTNFNYLVNKGGNRLGQAWLCLNRFRLFKKLELELGL